MEEKKIAADGFDLIYARYIKDDPARTASFYEELARAEIARDIYDLRCQAGLTHEQFAALVGVSASTIEDVEEADYDGDFLSMASRIATALHRRIQVRLLPAEDVRSPDGPV
jgi:DNA-binding XRE family transcriptional regulator